MRIIAGVAGVKKDVEVDSKMEVVTVDCDGYVRLDLSGPYAGLLTPQQADYIAECLKMSAERARNFKVEDLSKKRA